MNPANPFPYIMLEQSWIDPAANMPAYKTLDVPENETRHDFLALESDRLNGYGWSFVRLHVFPVDPTTGPASTGWNGGLQIQFMSAKTRCRASGLAECLRAAADALDNAVKEST